MSSVIVSHHRASLIELLGKVGYCESNLQIVQDIKEYCQSMGHPHLESSDQRVGKCLLAEGRIPMFVLRDEIIQSDYMVPLFARNFPREDIEKLDDPRAFVQHLLLHAPP